MHSQHLPQSFPINFIVRLLQIFTYTYKFIYYTSTSSHPRGRHASCREMRESRRLVKLKDMKKEIFPFLLLSCGLGHRRISALPGLKAVASRQGHGFILQQRLMHFPTQTPTTHSYHAPFSLLAWHPNLSSSSSPSRYQSTSPAAYPLWASIAWVGVDGFAFCPDPFFLRSFLLVCFLCTVACRPRGSGIRCMSNK